MSEHESMTEVACSEPTLSEELRAALVLLRDRSDDDEFHRIVDDVLTGRCGLVDASAMPAFSAAVFAPVAQEYAEFVGQTTDEQQDPATEGEPGPAALCAALHQRSHTGESGTAAGPCGGCVGQCALSCADPPQ